MIRDLWVFFEKVSVFSFCSLECKSCWQHQMMPAEISHEGNPKLRLISINAVLNQFPRFIYKDFHRSNVFELFLCCLIPYFLVFNLLFLWRFLRRKNTISLVLLFDSIYVFQEMMGIFPIIFVIIFYNMDIHIPHRNSSDILCLSLMANNFGE